MIIEKIAGHLQSTDKKIDKVSVEWYELNKRRLRKKTRSGIEMGICVNQPLNDNDILYENEEYVIVVDIVPSELIKISVSDMPEMGRLCFEIGNRHIPLAIKPDNVTIPYDEPTFEYLKKLGFKTEKIIDKFSGYTECKGHNHHEK